MPVTNRSGRTGRNKLDTSKLEQIRTKLGELQAQILTDEATSNLDSISNHLELLAAHSKHANAIRGELNDLSAGLRGHELLHVMQAGEEVASLQRSLDAKMSQAEEAKFKAELQEIRGAFRNKPEGRTNQEQIEYLKQQEVAANQLARKASTSGLDRKIIQRAQTAHKNIVEKIAETKDAIHRSKITPEQFVDELYSNIESVVENEADKSQELIGELAKSEQEQLNSEITSNQQIIDDTNQYIDNEIAALEQELNTIETTRTQQHEHVERMERIATIDEQLSTLLDQEDAANPKAAIDINTGQSAKLNAELDIELESLHQEIFGADSTKFSTSTETTATSLGLKSSSDATDNLEDLLADAESIVSKQIDIEPEVTATDTDLQQAINASSKLVGEIDTLIIQTGHLAATSVNGDTIQQTSEQYADNLSELANLQEQMVKVAEPLQTAWNEVRDAITQVENSQEMEHKPQTLAKLEAQSDQLQSALKSINNNQQLFSIKEQMLLNNLEASSRNINQYASEVINPKRSNLSTAAPTEQQTFAYQIFKTITDAATNLFNNTIGTVVDQSEKAAAKQLETAKSQQAAKIDQLTVQSKIKPALKTMQNAINNYLSSSQVSRKTKQQDSQVIKMHHNISATVDQAFKVAPESKSQLDAGAPAPTNTTEPEVATTATISESAQAKALEDIRDIMADIDLPDAPTEQPTGTQANTTAATDFRSAHQNALTTADSSEQEQQQTKAQDREQESEKEESSEQQPNQPMTPGK